MSCREHSPPSVAAGTSGREDLENPYARQPVAPRSSTPPPNANKRPGGAAAAGRSSPVQVNGGYDAYFDPGLDKKLECPICLFALRDPIQTSCGHRFCRTCIERSLRADSKTCPVDKRRLTSAEIYPDNWCRREVMCLKCKCRHMEDGCQWHGQLKDFEEHIESACDYVTVSCPNAGCDVEVRRMELHTHLEQDCSSRIVLCEFCGEGVSIKEIGVHHSDHCVKVPLECPQECGMDVPRCELDEHTANLCERSAVRCQHIGCDWTGVRTEYSEHCRENLQQHIEIANLRRMEETEAVVVMRENLVLVQTELIETRAILEAMRASANGDSKAMDMTRNLGDKLVNISRVVDHTVLRVSDAESRIIQLERRAATDRADVKMLSEKLERTTTTFQNNMAKVLTIIEQQSSGYASMPQLPSAAAIAAMPISSNLSSLVTNSPNQADPAVSYDGTMVWKICGWMELRLIAIEGKRTSVYSSPFYTAMRGYKVRIRLYPNGDGMGKANSLSIFFTLCRGEFDGLLPWPFKSKVTFTLLDRSGGSSDLSESFVPDSNSTSFHQPQKDMNIASGCPLFVPLHRVSEEGRYVLNDSIMIKVVVEAPPGPR